MTDDELKRAIALHVTPHTGEHEDVCTCHVVQALVDEVRRLKDARDLATVEAGVYLGALALALAKGGVELADLARDMDPDAYAIVREGVRSLR